MRFQLITAFAVSIAALAATQPAFAAPVEYVRVCTDEGAGYYYVPGTDTCVNPLATDEGVAISLALPNATIEAGKQFGAGVNIGTFNGETAIGLSGAFAPADGITLNGGVGFGLSHDTVAGRAGINVSW